MIKANPNVSDADSEQIERSACLHVDHALVCLQQTQ